MTARWRPPQSTHSSEWTLAVVLLACPVTFWSWRLDGTAATVCQTALPLALFPLVYRVATTTSVRRAVLSTALLAVCWQAGGLWLNRSDGFSPPIYFGTVGPCAVGLIVGSRNRARERLAAQTLALTVAREQHVAESVRYERIRIARELHDVVAHSVSAMVVQAHAGERLAVIDPARAAEAFDHIVGSAHQAAAEIERLVTMLEPEVAPAAQSIDELVSRARATGLAVSYRVVGGVDRLDVNSGATAYAIIRESLTNALKHAPGAPIEVEVLATSTACDLIVTNGPSRTDGLHLSPTGGQHGVAGMRARLAVCGGTLVAEPTAVGGWRVAAHLPSAG